MATSRVEGLHLRLFIEGVEVPVISATVQLQVQSHASAFIQIIGTEDAFNFKPRSIVELYYREQQEARDLGQVVEVPSFRYGFGLFNRQTLSGVAYQGARTAEGATTEQLQLELQYNLLFLGELTGYSIYEDTRSRTVNLLCADLTNHLDSMVQFIIQAASEDLAGSLGVARISVASGVLNAPLTQGVSAGGYAAEGVNATGGTPEEISMEADEQPRTPGDIQVVAEGLAGVDEILAQFIGEEGLVQGIRKIFENVKEQYIYYLDADQEFNLKGTVKILEDPVTTTIFRNSTILKILQNNYSRSPDMMSLRNILKVMFRLVNFEFTPNSTVAFDIDPGGHPALPQTILKPELYFAEPPACNLIFPDEIYSFNFSRHFLAEYTRGIDYTDSFIAPDSSGANDEITKRIVVSPLLVVGADGKSLSYSPPEAVRLWSDPASNIRTLREFGRLLLPEEIFKGIIPSNTQTSYLQRSSVLTGQVDSEILETAGKTGSTGTSPELLLEPGFGNLHDTAEERYFALQAAYKFFTNRFQSRSAAVSCKFLPKIAVGFPSLVMEKAANDLFSQLSDPNTNQLDNNGQLVTSKVPTFFGFFGHILQVTHFVSQAGGVTSINLSHVRPTNEPLDFIKKDDILNDLSTLELIPDLRRIGTAPWAQTQYGVNAIQEKYKGWLGGLTWKGTPAVNDLSNYLGILPISAAINAAGISAGTFSPNTPIGTTPAETVNILFTDLTSMVLSYVLQVQLGNVPVEEFAQRLRNRPVANLLQVRGYMAAYNDQVKQQVSLGLDSGTRDTELEARVFSHRRTRTVTRRKAVDNYLKSLVVRGIRG